MAVSSTCTHLRRSFAGRPASSVRLRRSASCCDDPARRRPTTSLPAQRPSTCGQARRASTSSAVASSAGCETQIGAPFILDLREFDRHHLEVGAVCSRPIIRQRRALIGGTIPLWVEQRRGRVGRRIDVDRRLRTRACAAAAAEALVIPCRRGGVAGAAASPPLLFRTAGARPLAYEPSNLSPAVVFTIGVDPRNNHLVPRVDATHAPADGADLPDGPADGGPDCCFRIRCSPCASWL